MSILKGLIISFSMYSIIPMPKINWEKENMKYAFCFLPIIGLIIGFASYLWYIFCGFLNLNSVIFASVAAVLPIIISGGIHLDGLIDTCDAIFSYGDKEKKLEILKDPRTGAFGVIGCAVYLLLQIGFFSQLKDTPKYVLIFALSFFISRCIGALAIIYVTKAKSTGLGAIFSESANKTAITILICIYLIIGLVVFIIINWLLSIIIFMVLSLFIFYFIHIIKKDFGGITGDLTGFMILATELTILALAAFGSKL